MKSISARYRFPAAAALLVVVAGCSPGADEADTPLPIRLVRITSDTQSLTPAAALLPNADEREAILLAHDTLLADCVAEQGESLSLAPDSRMAWVEELAAQGGASAPFGPVDPARMARYGYHDPVQLAAGDTRTTWTGSPTATELVRSCDDTVTAQLGGRPPLDLLRLMREAGERAGSDPRREAPRAAWSRCMRESEFSYAGDHDPWIQFALDPAHATAKASREEVRVATADAGCQQRTRNIDTHVALVVAYEEQALTDNAERVTAYRNYLTTLLSRATEIVTTQPAPTNRQQVGPPT